MSTTNSPILRLALRLLAEGPGRLAMTLLAIVSSMSFASAALGDLAGRGLGSSRAKRVGLVDVEGTAGAQFVLFVLPTAQTVYQREGLVDSIDVTIGDQADLAAVQSELAALLPMGIEAVDRTQLRVGVAIEAVTIGLIGSAIGLAGGVGLSTLMKPSTARSAPTR